MHLLVRNITKNLKYFFGSLLLSLGSFGFAQAAYTYETDAKVTAVGQAAARAREVLNWALSIEDAGFGSTAGALRDVWGKVSSFTTVFMLVIVMIIAFGLILHTSWAQEQRRSFVYLAIAFAASYLTFATSVIVIKGVSNVQDRLMKITVTDSAGQTTSRKIKAEDFLAVNFSHQDFVGKRSTDPKLQESADNTLTLLKATTWTNYGIAAVLILRIIILWLLVIFSPLILPMFAFSATKNVASLWLRELTRWIFIGPILAVFLSAVPYIWQHTKITPTFVQNNVARNSGIPLQTNKDVGEPQNVYRSGTNILLAPPGETDTKMQISEDPGTGNNLSDTDTYARYLVALAMIWVALGLPFLFTRTLLSVGAKAASALSSYQIKDYLRLLGGGTRSEGASHPNHAGELAENRSAGINQIVKPIGHVITAPSKERELSSVTATATGHRQAISESLKTSSVRNIISDMGVKLPSTLEMIQHQESLSKAVPISIMAKAEIEGARAGGFLQQLEQTGANSEQKNADFRTALVAKQMEGSFAAKNFNRAIANDTTKLVSQDITTQMVSKNLQALKEVRIHEVADSIEQKAAAGDPQAKAAMPAVKVFRQLEKYFNDSKDVDEIVKDNSKIETVEKIAKDLSLGIRLDDINGKIGEEKPLTLESVQQNLEQKASEPQTQAAQQIHPALHEAINNGSSQAEALKTAVSPVEKEKLEQQRQDVKSNLSNPEMSGAWQAFASELKSQQAGGSQTADKVISSANNITRLTSKVDLPVTDNQIKVEVSADQETKQQFEKAKQTWLDFYKNAEIPEGAKTGDRKQYLENEVSTLGTSLAGLENEQTRPEALKKLQSTTPYALLGGLEMADVVVYVQAKLEAAKEALKSLFGQGDDEEEGSQQGGGELNSQQKSVEHLISTTE